MQTTEDTPILKYDTLVASTRGLTETHGSKVVIFVPAIEIERLTLRFGRSDHRPVVTLTLGAVFTAVGVVGIYFLVMGSFVFRYELVMLTLGLIGGSLIYDTLKTRYYLEVHLKKGTRRLIFSKHARLEDVRDFCDKVGAIYKYHITDTA